MAKLDCFWSPRELREQIENAYCMEMEVRQTRVPQGNGWYFIARGAVISRKLALKILILGPRRSKIQTVQTQDPDHWRVDNG